MATHHVGNFLLGKCAGCEKEPVGFQRQRFFPVEYNGVPVRTAIHFAEPQTYNNNTPCCFSNACYTSTITGWPGCISSLNGDKSICTKTPKTEQNKAAMKLRTHIYSRFSAKQRQTWPPTHRWFFISIW